MNQEYIFGGTLDKFLYGACVVVALLLLAFPAPAQTPPPPFAVYNDFSPTVKGITVGDSHCYFWHFPSPPNPAAPWALEIACYTANVLHNINVYLATDTVDISWQTPDGAISYQFRPNTADPAKFDFQLNGTTLGRTPPSSTGAREGTF